MNPKCNLSEEERERILCRFPRGMTVEREDKIREALPQYLFFRTAYDVDLYGDMRAQPWRHCICSACGTSFDGIRFNGARGKLHNEQVTCPYCGRTITGKAVDKFKPDMPSLSHWVKTAFAWTDHEGAILVEAGDAYQSFSHEDLTGWINFVPLARYYFAKGKCQMWENVDRYRDGSQHWLPKKTVCEPFMPNVFSYYDGEYAVHGLFSAVQESQLKYCQIEPFMEYAYHATEGQSARFWMKYLAWATQHPQMEMAVKWNFYQPVWELITEGKKNNSILNWKASTPERFLRISKAEAKDVIRSGMEFDDFKAWRQEARELNFHQFDALREVFDNGGINTLKVCSRLSGESLKASADYVKSLLPKCPGMATASPPAIARIWKDYLEMAGKLGYDLKEKTVRMPKDLQERHDRAAETIQYEKNQEAQKKYARRYKALRKKYEFSYGGLSIVVPASADEIVREGRTLHHCVGGYAERHMTGATTILFLRKDRKRERSFLTIEIYEKNVTGAVGIRQIHGYQNERYDRKVDMREKFAWYLQPWLEWINAGSKRDKAGKPIMPAQEEKTA